MPPRPSTPPRASTAARSNVELFPDPQRGANLAVTVLASLAVFQGLFFLLPLASPPSRLLGIAFALGTLLASRILRDSPAWRTAAVTALAVVISTNFGVHLIATAPSFPVRMWQVAILVSYAATLLAAVTSLTGAVDFRRALNGWGAAAAVLLATEAVMGGPDDFSPTAGKVEWVGTTVQDSALGARFAPNTVVKTFYPDNPRGYFDEPDALQRRWVLQSREGSKAQLEFPAEKRGVLRVNIADAPGKIAWHIVLTQAPIRVLADERYELRFRARADSVRSIFVAVGQAHPPWGTLGLYREARVDTTWRDYTQTFRATASDRVAQLYFNLGADHPSVELSGIVMRGISANKAVQAEARRELSVSYRINSQGCRGAEYPQRANPGSWRILSLGDGNSFGVGVHQGDTYAARLEALLNESGISRGPEEHYDVINCGVRGFSTQQERLLFNSVGPHFSPNLALLAVNPDDDRFTPEDERQPTGSQPGNVERLFHVWGLISGFGRPKPPAPDFASIVSGIKQIDADARARGTRLAVVLFQHRNGPDWNGLDSALTKGLSGSNIPVLNLGPVLLSFGEQKLLVHSLYDHHPNELAHRITAEALRKFLADQALLGETRGAGAVPVDSTGVRR